MQTKFLTEEEKSYGRRKVYTFQLLNGLAFNFMGETPVTLMAIYLGASNMQLGYISSVIYFAGFILVFLPKLLAGKNLIKVQSRAWFIRGLFVLLYLLLLVVKGQPGVILILIIYTLFCSARIIGAAIWNPLIKMVTNPQNRGEVLGKGNIYNQGASIISKLISFGITSISSLSGILGLLILQVLGVFFNSTASHQLKKIPCRENIEYEKTRNIRVIFIEATRNKNRRYPLLMRWFSISLMILSGLTIAFLKKEVGFSASFVFLYTMVIALANIASGFFAKSYADRVGSRPLLIGMNIFVGISFVLWMLIPVSSNSSAPLPFFYILGFISSFFLLSNNMLIDRLLVNTMPDDDSFGYHSMVNFVTAIFSILTGVLGGLLIDLGQSFYISLPNTYGILFFFIILLSFVLIALSFLVIDSGSLSTKETAAILFSIEGLKAFSDIGKLNTTNDPVKRKTVILSISQNNANIATEEMRTILASPLSPIKGEVIKAQFNHPRLALLPQIKQEALDYGSYHQMKAIFALGAFPQKDVEELLLHLLESSNTEIRSNAAKSLSRIGHKESLSYIASLEKASTTPWDKLNYLIALKNMDSNGYIFKNIFKSTSLFTKSNFSQTYYSLVSDLFDFKPQLSTVYTNINLKDFNGFKIFLEETRDVDCFNSNFNNLLVWYKNKNFNQIWNFCLANTINIDDNILLKSMNNLKTAIMEEAKIKKDLNLEVDSVSRDQSVAALFFTYQLRLKSVELK